jgi:nucleoid-associated protein YgaU
VTVGKDFRMGLMVGVVLVLAALLWVATRPSLTPQIRTAPVAQLSQTDAGKPLPGEEGGPRAGSGRPERARPSTAPVDTLGTPRPLEPKAEIPNPAAASGAPQHKPTPPRAEPMPESVSGANPTALPDLTIYERTEKIKTTKFHIVQRGETLSGIARLYYGAPDQWRKIVTANSKAIKDPNRVAPGTKLIIPE